MEHDVHEREIRSPGGRISLYAGIDLSYTEAAAGSLPLEREASEHVMRIHYCRAGQAVWSTPDGGSTFLNPGDFSLHMGNAGTNASFRFPTDRYQGLTISIDLERMSAEPPELLAGTGALGELLEEPLRRSRGVVFLTGTEQSEAIFSAFYGQPEKLALPYQRLKVLELLLYLIRMEPAPQNRLAEYPPEQVETIRNIHDQLLLHIDRRITIEALSRQYLINPTTLKNAFKAVYGTSLAAHIKEHRMEQAAKMLRETDRSIAEIAQAVGYDSQSRFAAAFKGVFQVLPREYRKTSGTP